MLLHNRLRMKISSPLDINRTKFGICTAEPPPPRSHFPESTALSLTLSNPNRLYSVLVTLNKTLNKQFPVAGVHLSNPLVEIDAKVGEMTLCSCNIAVTTQDAWHGELIIYLDRDLHPEEHTNLSNHIAHSTGVIVNALRQTGCSEDDLGLKSLLFPDPALVESLCYREGRLCMRNNSPFSVLFLSCDQFVQTILQYGERFAATLLRNFCRLISCQIRDYDFFLRYSKNEFALLLNNTSIENAQKIANRLSTAVQTVNYSSVLRHNTSLSASIGITQIDPTESAQTLLLVARHAMRLAQQRGGGQAVYSNGYFLPC